MNARSGGWCLLLLAVLCLVAVPAAAQTWPARPVRIIVPFAAGGATDTIARLLAERLTEQVGGPFLVENRPGAGGLSGAEFVRRFESERPGQDLLKDLPTSTEQLLGRLNAARSRLAARLEERESSLHNPVSQTGMSEGEVTLF